MKYVQFLPTVSVGSLRFRNIIDGSVDLAFMHVHSIIIKNTDSISKSTAGIY